MLLPGAMGGGLLSAVLYAGAAVSSRPTITLSSRARAQARLRSMDLAGNRALYGLCAVACLLLVITIAEICYQVITGSSQAMSTFGIGFLFHTVWQPNFGRL